MDIERARQWWLEVFRGIHSKEPPSIDWQPVQPHERNTDGMPRVIHQREQPIYEPTPVRPMEQWRAQQAELHWRYPQATQTGPRELMVAGHAQKIIPHQVPYTPPGAALKRATGPHTPIPPAPPETRDLSSAELPAFLTEKAPNLPTGSLPVDRNLLATMRASESRFQLDAPSVEELPTLPTREHKVEQTMAKLPPWEPLPAPNAPPPDWLNSNVERVEMWSGPEVEAQPERDTEPTQKLVPELRYTAGNAPTAPDEIPALRRLLMLKYEKKVSE